MEKEDYLLDANPVEDARSEKENSHGENSSNDDDSVSSTSSIDSALSSSSTETIPLTLMERQKRNIARNEKFLGSLHEKYQNKLATKVESKSIQTKELSEDDEDDETNINHGMIMEGTYRLFRSTTNGNESYAQRIQRLHEKYPHRRLPIDRLASLLCSTVSLSSTISNVLSDSTVSQAFVPPPVFCVGPSGTGKTAVVCDLMDEIISHHSTPRVRVQPAYVDCSIVEPSTVDRLVYTIYKQLKPSSTTFEVLPRKRKKKASPLETQDSSGEARVLPIRRAKKAAIHKTLVKQAETSYDALRKNRKTKVEETDMTEEDVETTHSAIMALGRSLQAHYGPYCDDNGTVVNANYEHQKSYVGILVLDRAEELLSLSASSKKGTQTKGNPSNALSELLLLPKIMKLNVTIVVLTNYATLDCTRLNNAVSLSKGLSTISSAVHPIHIAFPAYKGNQTFRDILSTPHNQELVMGKEWTNPSHDRLSTMRFSFRQKLFVSFWNILIQFVSGSTRDVRDFQRLGRALWPSFVRPLLERLPSLLKAVGTELELGPLTKTTVEANHAKLEEALIRKLEALVYPFWKRLLGSENSLTLLLLDESGTFSPHTQDRLEQPYLRNCLLLAAFVCQHNKADQDRKVFSVHGNGRRRRSKASANEDIYGGDDEDLAFGSIQGRLASNNSLLKQVEQLRSIRLHPVPLERVFSIFVTLVRLNPRKDTTCLEETMEDLGSGRLYRDLAHLVALGYLHYCPTKASQSLLHAPLRILCTMAKEEALDIANNIGIPLQKYLI